VARGDVTPPEWRKIVDETTGARVLQLTDAPAWHLGTYFTAGSVAVDNETLVFASNRTGKMNLFKVSLAGGEITQLTDVPEATRCYPEWRYAGPHEMGVNRQPVLGPRTRWVYYFVGQQLCSVHLDTLEERVHFEMPMASSIGCFHLNRAETKLVLPYTEMAAFENMSPDEVPTSQRVVWKRVQDGGYLGGLLVFDIEQGKLDVWHEEQAWISHAQFCPTDDELVLYNHEGNWEDEKARMWVFDRRNDSARHLRPQQPNESIGHETWVGDSARVLYHGWVAGRTLVGFINLDGSGRKEYFASPHYYGHFASNKDGSLVVTDAGTTRDMISLVDFPRGQMRFRPLCRHATQWAGHLTHPHSHFTPDNTRVVFSASHAPGQSQVYIVGVEPS